MVFVFHRTVSMATVCQLKINSECFLDAKHSVNFPLEDKLVVNENHVIQKSHDTTQKNVLTWCISMYHMTG